MPWFLTIDVGTTAIKAMIIDHEGNPIGRAAHEYQVETSAPGIVELDCGIYWNACVNAVKELVSQCPICVERIKAIGFSSQGETLVALNLKAGPLRKAIVWLDTRAEQEAREIGQFLDDEIIAKETGQSGVASIWPAAKILWLRRNEPEVFKRTDKFLLIKDYLLYRMTGELVSDYSMLSSTLMISLSAKMWWDRMLQFIGIGPDKLPTPVESTEPVGKLSKIAADEMGLPPGITVSAGAMDQLAAALGAGNIVPGMVTETTGAALAVVATVKKPIRDPLRRFPCHFHAVPNLYCLLAWNQTAGMVLKWFRDGFCQDAVVRGKEEGLNPYDIMIAWAEQVTPGCDGLLMIPHLSGTACPDFNPNARGMFSGICLSHTRSHFIRSILEAVAFMLREDLEAIESIAGQAKSIRSIGGGSRSNLWNQIKADVTQREVVTCRIEEASSVGAAILAAVASGIYTSVDSAVNYMVNVGRRCIPNPKMTVIYDEAYERWKELYRISKCFFRAG